MTELGGRRWRSDRIEKVYGSDISEALDALLSITYFEPEREWVERLLIGCLDRDCDTQVRSLAVICFGHVARLHGKIGSESVERLTRLIDDPVLGGAVEDALGDIESFVRPESEPGIERPPDDGHRT